MLCYNNTRQDQQLNKFRPGPIALFGSGETMPGSRKVYNYLLDRLPSPPQIALLETPAGFELNSDRVIGRVGDFLKHHFQNFDPQIEIVPARRRGTYHSPDNAQILKPLLEADLIFMGPGSPSYAVRQLRGSLAWDMVLAHHYMGGAIAFASAATVAVSSCALPVYEIFKVGEDLHWKEGLNFFGLYGPPLVFIPHWNNNDGGNDLDTSRCFMGMSRFTELLKLLPEQSTVIGIDELTALIIEPEHEECHVIGKGGVTINHLCIEHEDTTSTPEASTFTLDTRISSPEAYITYYKANKTFPMSEIGAFHLDRSVVMLPSKIKKQILKIQKMQYQADNKQEEIPPERIITIVMEREKARLHKDWVTADNLRDEIANQGWEVIDTPDGPQLNKLEN